MTKKEEPGVVVDPIVEQLRALRELAGFEQQQVAEDLGVSKSHYSQIERGHADPRLSQVRKLSVLFDRQLVLTEPVSITGVQTAAPVDSLLAVKMTPYQAALAMGMLLAAAGKARSEGLADSLQQVADLLAEALGS